MNRLILFVMTVYALLLPAMAESAGDVAQVNALLKRAEANLQLVDGSIGHLTKAPKGSAAKLGKMRLDQAKGDMQAAKKTLDALTPGKGVAEASARYKAAEKLHGKLMGILTGKAPAPKPGPAPKPEKKEPAKKQPEAPKTVRLGYPHADNFKSTLFTLRRVENEVAAMVAMVNELRPIEDQLSINYRKASGAMTALTETRRQAGFVQDGLNKIPANGEGVAEAKQRLTSALTSIEQARAYFKPLDARLMDLVNPANYPEIRSDLGRLRELINAYGNLDHIFREERTKAAGILSQVDAVKTECIRIAQKYVRLMEQETDLGKGIEIAGNNLLERQSAFLAAANQQKTVLPAEIRNHLTEVDRMANDAVSEQEPLWFTGGIPQRVQWIDDKFVLFSVLDPGSSTALGKEVEAMKASLRQRADSLKELIIRENPLPSDSFAGPDREAAIAVALDAWKYQEADFELLAVRIPSDAWSRETKWTYSNGTWYFVDKSTLQVRLIVADKENPAQAIDRAINVRKDHQIGDSLIGLPLRNFNDPLPPSSYLLRSKIK